MHPVFIREVIGPPRFGRTITIGVACALVVAAAGTLLPVKRTLCFGGESKVDIARLTVKKYALEAYPSWATAHPRRACPRSILELDEYMSKDGAMDPWNNPYYFACGPRAIPKRARGVWVLSAGEDGVFGTADDIRSDE